MADSMKDKLFYSIQRELKNIIKRDEEILKKLQTKLDDPEKKLTWDDKRAMTSYEKELNGLYELESLFHELKFSDTNNVELPYSLNKDFNNLGTLLSEQEIMQLRRKVNDSMRSVNANKKNNIKQLVAKIQKVLNQIKLDGRSFSLFSTSNNYANEQLTFNKAMEKLEDIKLKELSADTLFTKYNPVQVKLGLSDEMLLSSTERMIKSNQLEQNKRTQAIINNFSSIKEAFKSKAKLEQVLSALSMTIPKLSSVTEINMSEVRAFLTSVENKYRRELAKVNAYLSKFDFSSIKKQIEEKREEEKEDSLEQQKITEYEELAYELEQAKSINPHDREKIEKIQKEMQRVAINSNLTDYELQSAMIRGQNNYHKEMREHKLLAAKILRDKLMGEKLESGIRNEIYESMLRELELSGQLKTENEYRNGDVYSASVDMQALMERAMGESKEHDSFMEPSELQEKANEVYKEYIKYRASLKNKKHYLKFSEYAKQFYNGLNVNEDMVDSELISSGGLRR